ncbi:chorismate--pyruvate lyase family protein [Leeia oryzae]|uniref:chorismate--pyruvate lyase family protein n=1 Tax=Leeia oryzae TaxID=356662 RepID=UPI000360835A|nr:chorismate lyase [Leeia oryzae]
MKYRHLQSSLKHPLYDPVWHSGRVLANAQDWAWLGSAGSLTWRLKQLSPDFAVTLMRSVADMPTFDEWRSIGLTKPGKVWTRDVCLTLEGEPMVVAHSITPLAGIRHVWRSLHTLARRPLAELLFTDPAVIRLPLAYAKVSMNHPLHQQARQILPHLSCPLWARRSVFVRHAVPLMVTEVFLPNLWNKIHGQRQPAQ